jgi:hypothetical protein
VMTLNCKVVVLVGALSVMLASVQRVQVSAATTMLVCKLVSPAWTTDQPTTIELNEAQGTILMHQYTTHAPEYGNATAPGWTWGPLPATFNAETITANFFWQGDPRQFTLLISRLTGDLTVAPINWKWSCHAGSAQF